MDEKAPIMVVDLQEVFDNRIQHNATPLMHNLLPSETVTDVLPEPEKTAYPVYDGKSTVVVNGFWGAHKPSITKIQEESDSKLTVIKFYKASSKIEDRVEPRGLRFYPPLSNKDYFLDSRGRTPKLYSTRVTSSGGTVYHLFKMAYFDEKRNSYDEKSAFKGSEYDGVFDHIDDVGPYLAGNTRSGRDIRYELEDEQEKKQEIHHRNRDDEPVWGVCQGEEIRKDDIVLQEKCAYGRMLGDLSDKGRVINAWDQYFINLKSQPYIPQKHEEFDGEWPGDELHTLYVPTRQYTLEEAMIRKIDLTMALDMPLTLKVTGGEFNKFDKGMKVRKELEYKSQNGFLHCRICNKYHIKPGGPMSISTRDTCGAFLPLWFPVNDYNCPPLSTPWESFRKLFYEVLKLAQYLEKVDDKVAEVRLKQLYEWIAKHSLEVV